MENTQFEGPLDPKSLTKELGNQHLKLADFCWKILSVSGSWSLNTCLTDKGTYVLPE